MMKMVRQLRLDFIKGKNELENGKWTMVNNNGLIEDRSQDKISV